MTSIILREIKAQTTRNGDTLENRQVMALYDAMLKNDLKSFNLFCDVCVVKFVRYGVHSYAVHREWYINPKLLNVFQSILMVK